MSITKYYCFKHFAICRILNKIEDIVVSISLQCDYLCNSTSVSAINVQQGH